MEKRALPTRRGPVVQRGNGIDPGLDREGERRDSVINAGTGGIVVGG